ncbi:MAG: hypothetical protein JJT89_03715 [Nitriliruptoraceae bacterium]|nr:hypothetical protein [Nitriliruptoraceae bacterium]
MAAPSMRFPREQVRAAIVLAAIISLGFVIWGGLALVTTAPVPRASDPLGGGVPPRDAAPPGADGPEEGDDGEEAGDQDAADDVADGDAGGDGTQRVDFDGGCTAELAPEELSAELRPWDLGACPHAPIAVPDGEARYIVVTASLFPDEVDEQEARRRADAAGDEVVLLWSTHYPSLTPDLWVVAAGPFPDQDAADAEAQRRGGGAYVRGLVDEPGDRYCLVTEDCAP